MRDIQVAWRAWRTGARGRSVVGAALAAVGVAATLAVADPGVPASAVATPSAVSQVSPGLRAQQHSVAALAATMSPPVNTVSVYPCGRVNDGSIGSNDVAAAAAAGATTFTIVLGFAEPAYNGGYGTDDNCQKFMSLGDVMYDVEQVVYGIATESSSLCSTKGECVHADLGVGTSDDCGDVDKCVYPLPNPATVNGVAMPGDEAFGYQWGYLIDELNSWISMERYGETTLFNADDAEPAYDPATNCKVCDLGETDTFHFLTGVHNNCSSCTGLDFGSAESGYWPEADLFKIAAGVQNQTTIDYPMIQVSSAATAANWAALDNWACGQSTGLVIFWGVMNPAGSQGNAQADWQDLYNDINSKTYVSCTNGTQEIPYLTSI